MPLVAFFSDRRAAFRFVAEVRRLYDVSRWSSSDVVPTRDGAVVHLAAPPWITGSLRELAVRYGGQLPSTPEDARRMIDGAKAEPVPETRRIEAPAPMRASFDHVPRHRHAHARRASRAAGRRSCDASDDGRWLPGACPPGADAATLRG